MMGRRRPGARGFTLIELMIVVAIIGILASVALPMIQVATLRARAAERTVVCRALAKAVEDIYAANGAIGLVGTPNPAGTPGTAKRNMNWALTDWVTLGKRLNIEGSVYYTYRVVSADAADPPTLDIIAQGDLDGDGLLSTKTWHYERTNGAYLLVSETPAAGQEDQGTF